MARVFDTQANQSFDVTFERLPARIGRNQLNDLHVDRPYVSQFHASVDIRDGRLLVKDLGSTNGTSYRGQRLVREQPVDVTDQPEINIGPLVIRLQQVAAPQKPREEAREGAILDLGDSSASLAAASLRGKPIAPGQEDPFVRQVLPYIEAYRAAWGGVYRVIYDHLTRLPPEIRTNYLKRLAMEHAPLSAEPDFQKIAHYYGVDAQALAGLGPPQAALAALTELSSCLAPGTKALSDVGSVLHFARKLRDSMEVFLKCFVSLRDGYKEFEAEVLARDRGEQTDRVATAKDSRELGVVLFDASSPSADAPRQLHDIFVDVMSHQVALLNGVMEGVKSLLKQLSPKAIEEELDKRGKRGGLFSNRYEALWKLYEVRHGDYSGEDKETFLIIFGPQFSRAYAATAGEDYQSSSDTSIKSRFTMASSQLKR